MRASEPWLATIIPVLNEEEHIEACLHSLINQSLPANEHIVVVLDGGSSDSTKELVQSIIDGIDGKTQPSLYLHDNPGRFVPHARNFALQWLPRSITHVLEFNGHIEIETNHLETMKAAWYRIEKNHPKIAGLGCRVVGSDAFQNRVESILNSTLESPLGGSTGQFANFAHEETTNVPAFALHRRSALDEVGGWDETFLTSQDSDLSMRLTKAGYTLFRTPELVVKMRRRSSFRNWFLMSHRYGFWRTKVLRKHPKRLVLREFLPLFGLMLVSLLWFFEPAFALVPLATYGIVLAMSGLLNLKKGLSHALGVPYALFLLHVGFTLGLIDGLIRKGRAPSDR